MIRFPLLIQALRWRAASSLVLLAVATAAILAAAVGPIYLLASDESVIRNSLETTPIQERGLTLTASVLFQGTADVSSVTQRAQAAAQAASQMGVQHWFGPAVRTATALITLPGKPSAPEASETDLVARQGVCRHLKLVAGNCPLANNEAAISDRSAKQLGADLGAQLPYRLEGFPQELKVVGIYAPGDISEPYWFGRNFFTFAPPLREGAPFEIDAVFVSEGTIDSLPVFANPSVTEELPLNPDQVDQANLATLKSDLAAYSRSIDERFSVSTASGLPATLSRLQDEEQQMGEIVALAGVQLVLLALLVLYGVVSGSAQTREHEVALARLRGHGRLGVLTVGLLEPLAVLAVAYPLGVILAWLTVRLVLSRTLLPGTPIVLDLLTVAAGAAALAGGVVAAALGGSQLLVRSLHDQLRAARAHVERGRLVQIGDVIAFTLALAGLIELVANGTLRGGQADPLAVIAPGLLVLALAVISMRLLPLICRPLVRFSAGSQAGGAYLAVRRLVRLPQVSRQLLVPSLAVGLAIFAVSVWTTADHNRAELAGFQVGADRVLTVRTAPGVDLVTAVRAADPSGQQAMAAVRYSWAGGNVLAVDSPRFGTIANWPASIAARDASAIGRWLTPRTEPPVIVRGGAMRMGIALAQSVKPAPSLVVTLVDQSGRAQNLAIGPLMPGSNQYTADLPSGCAAGCRITTITQTWPLGVAPNRSNSIAITNLDAALGVQGPWQAVAVGWANPAQWRPGSSDVTIAPVGNSAGLQLSFANRGGDDLVTSADVPVQMTAIVTPDQVTFNGNGDDAAIHVEGLDGRSLVLDGRVQSLALPRLGPSGVLVDLTLLQREQESTARSLEQEVWLSAHAGPDIERLLAKQGVTVLSIDRAATLKAYLDARPLSLAFALMLFASVAGALLAAGSTVFAAAAGARRYSYEMAVLRASGWGRRVLARGMAAEQLVVLVTACVIGAAAGVGGAILALPSVPEFTDPTWGLPFQYNLPVVSLAVVFVSLSTALLAVAVAASLSVLRMVGPGRLRARPE